MPLQRGQADDTLRGQLEQEASGGEIFETAAGIAPVPELTQFASEPFAAVLGDDGRSSLGARRGHRS